MNPTITAVPGVAVGHWTDPVAATGCTVVVLPEPNVVTVEIRGAAPGTREIALLGPGMRVEQAQALLLTGGSAFGLAAADGVVRALAADGRGHPTPAGPVPIVPGAVVFDLTPGEPVAAPGPEEGLAAYRAATTGPADRGRIGAGAGTSAAKWRGWEHRRRSGVGSAVATRDGIAVGALAVVNAVGDVFTLEGEPLTGGNPVPGPPGEIPAPHLSTTLAVVACDAALSRSELTRLAVRGQDAFAACIRPVHTRYDGDVCFAAACGSKAADVDRIAEGAFEAVGRAIEDAVRAAAPSDTL